MTKDEMIDEIYEMKATVAARDIGLGHGTAADLLKLLAERMAMRQVFLGMGSTHHDKR